MIMFIRFIHRCVYSSRMCPIFNASNLMDNFAKFYFSNVGRRKFSSNDQHVNGMDRTTSLVLSDGNDLQEFAQNLHYSNCVHRTAKLGISNWNYNHLNKYLGRKITKYGSNSIPQIKLQIDSQCTEAIGKLFDTHQEHLAMYQLQQFANNHSCPSYTTVLQLSIWASRNGDATFLTYLKSFSLMAYGINNENIMDHYFAYIYFKKGQSVEAFGQLIKLCRRLPEMRRYLLEVVVWIIDDILFKGNESLEKELMNFVSTLWNKLKEPRPAGSLWLTLFVQSTSRYQNMADDLLELSPGLVTKVNGQMNTVLQNGLHHGDSEIIIRLLQVLLKYQLVKGYPTVTGALLQLQCDIGNLQEAKETFRFAQEMCIFLTAGQVQRYLTFLSLQGIPIPYKLAAYKHSLASMAKREQVQWQYQF